MSDATTGLIRALAEHMTAKGDWDCFAMVLGLDGVKVNSVFGFAYAADGAVESVAASPYRIKDAVKGYTDSYYKANDPLPLKLLVQFDRTNGKYEVTFEDKDASRWEVTPDTFHDIPEQLRPHFD